jgi:competence protein ComEC
MVGFQLSFAAIFGMLTLSWQIKYFWNKTILKKLRRTGDAISASIGATAGTFPILASSFNRISTVSIIINLIIIPLASAATVLVFIAALFGLLFGQAASFAAFPAAFIIRIMLVIIKAAADIPFSAINMASPQLFIILAFLLIMYICSKYSYLKVKFKAILSALFICTSMLFILASGFSGMYLVFLDSGQGDTAFLKTEQGGEYFIDGGNENGASEVLSFTVRNGYMPDAAFLSHSDADHISGILKLYEAGLLNKIYCSWQEKDYVKSLMTKAEVIPLKAGDRVLLDDSTSALVLYPYRDTANDEKNVSSLVLLVEYNGCSALLQAIYPE